MSNAARVPLFWQAFSPALCRPVSWLNSHADRRLLRAQLLQVPRDCWRLITSNQLGTWLSASDTLTSMNEPSPNPASNGSLDYISPS